MEKVIGGVLGGAAFTVVVIVSLVYRMPFGTSALRALGAFALGFFVGWLLFGKVGLAIAREAAGEDGSKAGPQKESAGPPKA